MIFGNNTSFIEHIQNFRIWKTTYLDRYMMEEESDVKEKRYHVPWSGEIGMIFGNITSFREHIQNFRIWKTTYLDRCMMGGESDGKEKGHPQWIAFNNLFTNYVTKFMFLDILKGLNFMVLCGINF